MKRLARKAFDFFFCFEEWITYTFRKFMPDEDIQIMYYESALVYGSAINAVSLGNTPDTPLEQAKADFEKWEAEARKRPIKLLSEDQIRAGNF